MMKVRLTFLQTHEAQFALWLPAVAALTVVAASPLRRPSLSMSASPVTR